MFIRCLESSNQDIVNIALKNLAEFVLFAQGKSCPVPLTVFMLCYMLSRACTIITARRGTGG